MHPIREELKLKHLTTDGVEYVMMGLESTMHKLSAKKPDFH